MSEVKKRRTYIKMKLKLKKKLSKIRENDNTPKSAEDAAYICMELFTNKKVV